MIQEVGPTREEKMISIMKMLKNLGDVEETQISIKTTTGEPITLDVKNTDTIDRIKSVLHDKRHTLNFAGKQLKDASRTLSDYNIESESTLWESGRLNAGMGSYRTKVDPHWRR